MLVLRLPVSLPLALRPTLPVLPLALRPTTLVPSPRTSAAPSTSCSRSACRYVALMKATIMVEATAMMTST